MSRPYIPSIGRTSARLKGKALAELRYQCFLRDDWKCQMCFEPVSDAVSDLNPHKAHMAHIKSRGAGGADTLENVRTLCMHCHLVHVHNPKSVPRK